MLDEGAYPYYEDVNWALHRLWGERTGLSVLDVGCGYATTTSRIQARANRVTGIEQDPTALETARRLLHSVVEADLTDLPAVRAALGQSRFDVIVFGDVLEHVAWPNRVLRSYMSFLEPGGRILISVPNIGLWSVRLGHLFGRFDYQETGVLDRTHLRFFTLKSVRALLRKAHLRPLAWTFTPGLVRPFLPLVKQALGSRGPGGAGVHDPRAILDSGAYRAYLRYVHPAERLLTSLRPPLLAFQIVVECTPEKGV